jgi:hypothetical protein
MAASRHASRHNLHAIAQKECPLARAKRTDRADARRRYRAQLLTEPESELDDEDVEAPPARRAPTPPGPATPPRTGFRAAFSQSFRPVDLRGDLAYLPTLIRERAVLIPSAVSIVATVLFVALIAPRLRQPNSEATILDGAGVYLYQIFVWPPPIGASFLAGFLAKRASWLAGIVAGAVAAICVLASADAFLAVPGTTSGTATPPADPASFMAALGQSLIFSLPAGGVFAAMAAWYKRFLNTANPNRMQRQGKGRQGRDTDRRARDPRPARARGR